MVERIAKAAEVMKVRLTRQESRRLREQQQDNESDSNLIRRLLGFPALKHGGKREKEK